MALALDGGTPVRDTPFPSVSDASGRTFGAEEAAAAARVVASGTLWRVTGTEVAALEREFAALIGAEHAVASTSGTAALHLAVAAVDPEPGDEVVLPPITDFGTVIAVLACNAVPVFADVDPVTGCLTAESVAAKLSERTRAVIVVHLFGGPAPVDDITALCRRRGITVIEDCAQAYLTVSSGDAPPPAGAGPTAATAAPARGAGATRDERPTGDTSDEPAAGARPAGRYAGTRGDIGCFSLQQSKHISAGDGGLTVTGDAALARRMRLFADKGWPRDSGERTHLFLGFNYRMNEMVGAVARVQLTRLAGVVAARRSVARRLVAGLADLPGLRLPSTSDIERHSFWLFPMLLDPDVVGPDNAAFGAALAAEGIPATAGYLDRPLYLTPALAERRTFGTSGFPLTAPPARTETRYARGDCPAAEDLIDRTLVVVQCNERYTDADVRDIVTAVRKVYRHHAR